MLNNKLLLSVTLGCLLNIGCTQANRLLGKDGEKHQPDPEMISSGKLGPTPNFDVALINGYKRIVYHDVLKKDGQVTIESLSGILSTVAIKDNGIWFRLGQTYSGAFYYAYDHDTDTVTYKGKWIEGQEYCIYQDVPNI